MTVENAKEVKVTAQPKTAESAKDVPLSSKYTLRSNRVVAVTYGGRGSRD